MITQDEIDEIIRAYFNLKDEQKQRIGQTFATHQAVVDILKQYPEYANHFLTSKERGDDE